MSFLDLVAPKALDLAQQMVLSPDAKALLAANPAASASEFTQALASQNLNADAVGMLARGMKPQSGVLWASESAAKVASKLPPGEVQAAALAKSWVQGQASPMALEAQLAEMPLAGPGSWSAQAALLASEPPIPALGAMSMPALPGAPTPLTSNAIEGAVHLAASVDAGSLQLAAPAVDGLPALALPQPVIAPPPPGTPAMLLPAELTPPQIAAMNDALAPFVELGMQIAQGALPVA